jgi:integrase
MTAREATPFAANSFLKAMRAMFSWAKRSALVSIDPTVGISNLSVKSEGHHIWSDEEIEKFEACWPIGSRERLALALLLYTGLRRGDVVRLGRQHVRDGVITIRTEKTGLQVTIPVLPGLAAAINASPTSELAFVSGEGGRPMTKQSFGNWFAGACRAAGVSGRAHGLRKTFAVRGIEAGWTSEQLNAVMGHEFGSKESAVYIKKANRVRLAKEAIAKLNKR